MAQTRNRAMFAISLPARFGIPSFIRSIVLSGIVMLIALVRPSWADNENASAAAATAGEVANKQQMHRLFPDPTANTQQTPSVIPQTQIDDDPSGKIETFQPSGAIQTATNAFFQNLGGNGRTCFTCHQPQDGWSLSA
jgi:hypothetical protein